MRAFIAPLADAIAGRAHWTAFASFEDEVTDLELDGDDLYVLVNQGTPRGRLVKTAASRRPTSRRQPSSSPRVRMSSKAPCGRATAFTCSSWIGGIAQRLPSLGPQASGARRRDRAAVRRHHWFALHHGKRRRRLDVALRVACPHGHLPPWMSRATSPTPASRRNPPSTSAPTRRNACLRRPWTEPKSRTP